MKKCLLFICILCGVLTTTIALADNTMSLNFINALTTCSPIDETFVHPFTGQQMRRKIYGYQNGTCLYKERMPQNKVLVCHYPNSILKPLSNYYLQVHNGKNVESGFSTDFKNTTGTTKVDGKVLSFDPTEALNKYCKVENN